VKRLAALIVLGMMLAGPPAAVAACRQTTVLDVSREVMCTVCGVPLDEATDAPFAQRERAFIAREVARCRTKSEIKTALAAQFGDAVLATPRSNGIGIAAYAVPALAALLGLATVTAGLRRWRRRSARDGDGPIELVPAGPADLERRLDADLARQRR
jgi:cytochrome c-type biogenesis protein CcmH